MAEYTSGYGHPTQTISSKDNIVYFTFNASDATPDPAIPAHAKITSVFVIVYGNINTASNHGVMTANFGGQTLYQNGISNEGVGGLEGEKCLYGTVTSFFQSQNANAGKLKDSNTKISVAIDGPTLWVKYNHTSRFDVVWGWIPSRKITWRNYDGTFLDETYVPEDETPSYPKSNPEKPSDVQYHYTFACWTDQNGNALNGSTTVTSDTTYTAQYSGTIRQYSVTCIAGGDGGGVIRGYDAIPYDYGTKLTLVAESLYDHIEFVKWSDTGDTSPVRTITVVGNMSFTAIFKYKSHTVTFDPDNGSSAETRIADYGGTVTPPADPELADTAEWDYSFVGWYDEKNKSWWSESTTFTSDVTYTAQYDREKRKYTVNWYNWDGTYICSTYDVEYDTAPTYYGDTPTRDTDDYYEYTFAGWSPDPSIGIKGDTEYTAQFGWTDRYYVVRWVNGSVDSERINAFLASGEITQADYDQLVKFVTNPELLELEKDEVIFDTKPDYDEALHGIPVHPLQGIDPEYNYSFIGWSTEVTNPAKPDTELETVKGDITYTAMYATSKRTYAITVYVYNQNAEYVEYPYVRDYGETFRVEAPDDIVGYKFVRWSDGDTNPVKRFTVTGVVTLRAEYERSSIPVGVGTQKVTGVYIVPDANNPDTGEIVYVISGTVPEVTVKAVTVDGWHFKVSNTIPANSYPLEKLYIGKTRIW